MDKGQHLRLLLKKTDGNGNKLPIALATDLTFHVSATVENSTTKDTTDSDGGAWQENEATGLNGDIQFGALIAAGTDAAAKVLSDVIDGIDDTTFDWELAIVGGANNRVVSTSLATGKGKLVNVQMNGPNRQNATYTGSLNMWGPYVVA